MIRKTVYITVLTACSFSACQNTNEAQQEVAVHADTTKETPAVKATPTTSDIAYVVAQRYFVKNTVQQGPLANPKIETRESFDALFGAAAVMGKDGGPTSIDFARQYVIAVIADDTDIATELKPLSLQKDVNNQVILTYQVITGAKQSYTIRPVLILIVDKTNDGNVIVKEQEEG